MTGKNACIPQLPAGALVVIIRLRSLGDTVLTTPALAVLKQQRPDLRIQVVLEPPWDPLLAGNPDVAGVIRHRGAGTVAALRLRRPALCLNLHGGTTSAWLTALSGARWRAGFAHFRWGRVYNVRIPRAQQILGRDGEVHTAEHLASAMFYLGAAPCQIPRARLYPSRPNPRSHPGPYAVLHVGAAYFTKQWAPQRFAELARWLRSEQALEPVILTGPDQPLPAGLGEFESFGDLDLDRMMALLREAKLFVGNDSGPAHVAAAFGVPSVVIFGSSNSRVWYPWRTRGEVVETAWDCKPCPGDRCYAFDRPQCILSVEVEAVRRAVERVL